MVILDRAALGGIALGLATYVMPLWREGRLRWAFWLTLGSTLLHVYTSHKRSGTTGGPAAGGTGTGRTGSGS
jgi:hypothetical protein